MPMAVTSPSTMPRKSTGAPTDKPAQRLVEVHHARAAAGRPDRASRRLRRSRGGTSCCPAPARRAAWFGGVWNAMPPSTTVASDCVFSLKPLASSRRSTPLACHQRVLVPTYLSYGALTNTCIVTPRAVAVEREADHLADLHAPEVDRRADVERAERLAAQHELAGPLVAGDGGRRLEADELASASSVDLPASAPMYAPESSVPRPGHAACRRCAGARPRSACPSTAKSSASLVSCTSTSTREWSFDSVIVFTVPMSTSLYLTFVLPASSPSAVTKLIVIVGPRSGDRLHDEQYADQRRDERNHPDERRQPAAARLDDGLGQIRRQAAACAVSHGRSGRSAVLVRALAGLVMSLS